MTAKTNILYVVPIPNFFSQCDGVGGHIAHTHGVLRGLAAIGYNVTALTEEQMPFALPANVNPLVLPCKINSSLYHPVWSGQLLYAIAKLKKMVNPKYCYIRYAGKFVFWYPLLKKILNTVPLVLEVNSFNAQRYSYLSFLDKKALSRTDLIISISETNKTDLLQKLGKDLQDRIMVMPNGVDLERVSCDSKGSNLFSKKGPIKMGYLGILKPGYGLETLLKAVKILSEEDANVTLDFYGAGPLENELRSMASKQKNVFFHGPVPFQKVKQAYNNIDILVGTASPQTFQNSPIKLYEYMATGIPVVHAETPQVKKVVFKKKLALMYKWNEPRDLAKQVKKLIANPDNAKHMAQRALEEIKKHHTWEQRMKLLDEKLDALSK